MLIFLTTYHKYIFRYLVELALMNADFLNWRASMVAAAAVALSRYTAILMKVLHHQVLWYTM